MKIRWVVGLGLCLLARVGAEELPDPADEPVVRAVQRVLPAVVNISTERIVQRGYRDPFDEFWRQFFGQPQRRSDEEGAQSLGSGVIVDEDGWIVTNFHVVRRASKIHVQLNNGKQLEAQYVSGDEKNDLALLKVAGSGPLPAVDLALDRECLLGETVLAVGNPFGLEQTVTRGVLSAKNRSYTAGDVQFDDILQTDASINPGNSGGPLINARGELVGINMAILSQAQGIGFAIPARRVAAMLATWFTTEKRARLWLGVRFELEDGQIIIADVQADSPADKAGLHAKDQLLTVDDQGYRDILKLQRHLIHKKEKDLVKFAVNREGKRFNCGVRLSGLPKLSAGDLLRKRFGLQVQVLTRELAEAFGVPSVQGLLVSEVEKQSPAAEAGFRRGLVITGVAGEEFTSLDRLAEMLADINAGDHVPMAVLVTERRGNLMLQQTTSVMLTAR